MKRHEEGAECAPEKYRERHPQQMSAECDTDHAGRHGRQVRVAGKPDRPQMPHLAVPLGDRHIVYRPLLDHQFAEFCRHVCTFVLDPAENTNIVRPFRGAFSPFPGSRVGHSRAAQSLGASICKCQAQDRRSLEHDHLAVDLSASGQDRRSLCPTATAISCCPLGRATRPGSDHSAGDGAAEIGRPQFLAARRVEDIEIAAHVAEQ